MKIDPTKIAKLAQQVAQNRASGESVKNATIEVAKETVKTKITALLAVKVLPVVLVALIVILLVWFLVYSVSKTTEMFSFAGGTSCISEEEIFAKQAEIGEIEDPEEKKRAEDELNERIAKFGICAASGGGASPEAVYGGVYYDQIALHAIIEEIKFYLDGVGPIPNIDIIIQRVMATIDASDANIPEKERNEKKKEVAKKLRQLYNDAKTPKEKWTAVFLYLKKERGLYLWKAQVGNPIVAAVRTKIGKPYILGNRRNWTGDCYSNLVNDDAPDYKHIKGCGFDCSSLATYGSAVGNRQPTGIWVRGSDRIIEACKQYNSTLCPYNTTVSEIMRYAKSGPYTLLPNASELAPGDFVVMSKPGDQYFHVVIYAGKNSAGADTYVESPRGGKEGCPYNCVRERESWWGNLTLNYVRPYPTIMFIERSANEAK